MLSARKTPAALYPFTYRVINHRTYGIDQENRNLKKKSGED